MYATQLFVIMRVDVECMSIINALVQDQGMYVCEQTVDNYG